MTNDSGHTRPRTLDAPSPPRRPPPRRRRIGLPRRDFIKVAGAGAGALLLGGSAAAAEAPRRLSEAHQRCPLGKASPEIVVIGAGIWGSFTGATTCSRWARRSRSSTRTGPGNARSTSGDETRGVRSSYGDKTGPLGEALDALGARVDEALDRVRRRVGTRFPAQPLPRHRRHDLPHASGTTSSSAARSGGTRTRFRIRSSNPDDVRKSFPVFVDRRHHRHPLRARRRRRARPARHPDRGLGVREARRQDRHRPRDAIKDL